MKKKKRRYTDIQNCYEKLRLSKENWYFCNEMFIIFI